MNDMIKRMGSRCKQWVSRAVAGVGKAAVAVARTTKQASVAVARFVRPLWRRIGPVVSVVALAVWHALVWVWDALYGYHYGLGVFVLRKARRVARFAARITRKPRHFMRYLWIVGVTRPIHRFFRRIWRLVSGLPLSCIHVWKTKKKTVGNLLMWFPRSVLRWLRDFQEDWYALGRFLGPVAGIAVLMVTIQLWTETRFCLVLTYRGTELGIIENAAVYDEGASMARSRVNNIDKSFTVDAVPTLTMVVRGAKSPMTPSEVCDAILSNSFEEEDIKEAVGLYMEDNFLGAVEDGDALEAMLEELKNNSVKQDSNSGNQEEGGPVTLEQRIEFVQDIRTETGLFPISTLQGVETLRDLLAEEETVKVEYIVKENDTLSKIAEEHGMTVEMLQQLNHIQNANSLSVGQVLVVQRPRYFLQVVVVQTVRQDGVEIPYNTRTVYRDDKYTDWRQTTTKGVEGTKTVLTEVTLLDGYVVASEVVEEVVTKEAVTEVIEIGTKKRPSSNNNSGGGSGGSATVTGKWVWPVPVCHRVYQSYHSGHLAIDISSGPIPVLGKDAVAASDGEVIEASVGWNGGYGNVVKIRHANGVVTVYAHLQSVKVYVGQKVSAGQTIGLIGNTGYSFGPHLHFEVIKNGVKVNPLNYVKP